MSGNEIQFMRLISNATFESAQVLAGIKHIIVPANEQNFDRLETILTKV
jgi:hypothetical protein